MGQVRQVLGPYGFPAGELFLRLEGGKYKDAAERARPDVIIEEDCASIGGEVELTYPCIRPEIKRSIISIVVNKFGGKDHLPQAFSDLVAMSARGHNE